MDIIIVTIVLKSASLLRTAVATPIAKGLTARRIIILQPASVYTSQDHHTFAMKEEKVKRNIGENSVINQTTLNARYASTPCVCSSHF